MARSLARAGRDVLLLERGRDWRDSFLYGTYPGALAYADKRALLFTREGMNVIRPLMLGGYHQHVLWLLGPAGALVAREVRDRPRTRGSGGRRRARGGAAPPRAAGRGLHPHRRGGGNEVRKLEFVLAEARRRGAGRLITGGALGSHHGLATAVYGGRLGLPVTLVLYPQPPTDHVRDVLDAARSAGAELRLVPRMELLPAGLLRQRIRHRRDRPFVVVPGGSDGLGTLGYVNAGLELLEQVAAGDLPRPDVVHVACGTMGTAAGLALAFALADAPIRVSAVRVTPRIVVNRPLLRRLLHSVAGLLVAADMEGEGRRQRSAPPARALARGASRRLDLRHDQYGPGYGRDSEEGRRAAERLRGLPFRLDATYTAKAAADLLADLDSEERRREGRQVTHLYWHTLGKVQGG